MSGGSRPALASLIAASRSRWRALIAVRALTLSASTAALVLALALVVTWLFAPGGVAMVLLWTIAAAATLISFGRAAFLLRRRPGDLQVARFIEEQCPELEDTLVTAVGQGDVQGDATAKDGMAALVVLDAASRTRDLDIDRIVSRRALRVSGARAAAATIALCVAAGFSAAPADRAARLAGAYLFQTGSPVEALSPDDSAPAPSPPRVTRIDLQYEYPAAFGMQPRREEDSGDIYGPAGTRVRVRVFADKAMTEGALTLSGGQPVALNPSGDALEAVLTITANGSYRVALADAEGLRNPGDTEYFIRTLADRPPDVRILRPAGDRLATPIEEILIEARAEDDFGVAAFELVYSVRGGPERVVPFRRSGSGLTVNGAGMLYLEDFAVQPGDVVTYYARARDVGRGKPASEARSDIFFLDVVPFNEEFEASQGGDATAAEQSAAELVQAQKDVITATWNLDRRAREAGGRSDDDIRTVARGQRDLRARVVEMITRIRRANNLRRIQPGGRGQANAADPAMDTLGRATDLMSLAQTQLDGLNTADALPREMDALNALLRYQELTRERQQIGQQQAGGGGGPAPNRQQVDVSALFDRELARQQRTTYETSNNTGANSNDPAARLRELARRQDELAREQEQLARDRQQMSADDVKRELERLTREQTELRQRAEDLARQLQQGAGEAGGASRAGGASGAGGADEAGRAGEAARQLREAAQDMQGAASDLRRDDPQQASARSERAAERLRELEQQVRGGQPDDRRQALSEMQRESQQLADAQRRLTAETGSGSPSQPAPSPAPGAEERAAQQERLAARTERLEESVERMADAAAGGDARERNALAEAAREIDRARPAERMREAAGADRQLTREAGEQIAGALERLADNLGAAAGQSEEERRLAAELSRLQERREELSELNRELDRARQEGADAQQPFEDARELLDTLQQQGMFSPTDRSFNPGLSAPGTEAWKQDFARWDELKVQIAAALERAERTAADRLRSRLAADRLNAGSTPAVPEQYRRLVERYFRSLAAPGQ